VLHSTSYSLRRPVVGLLVLTLLVAMAAAVGQPDPAGAGDPASGPVRLGPSTGSSYNPVAPQLERTGNEREQLGRLDRAAGKAGLAPSAKVLVQATIFDRKHSAGNPTAAEQLGALEARSARTGKSPRFYKQAPRRPDC
jgi:immune inhibitor A